MMLQAVQHRRTVHRNGRRMPLLLTPRLKQDSAPPKWPPDVFGLCMSLLLKSGAYSSVLSNLASLGGERAKLD